ncbi:MAG: hypothetical protein HON70_01515 [Lentisphaerae bacterium]|jgi:hypothetical protein|nr:hypothetical protein [Lentisphaerota bacterium]
MSLTPQQRAEALFDQAEKLGLDAPTEDMVAEAINMAQGEAILHAGGMDAYNLWYGREVAGIDAVTCKPREDWED